MPVQSSTPSSVVTRSIGSLYLPIPEVLRRAAKRCPPDDLPCHHTQAKDATSAQPIPIDAWHAIPIVVWRPSRHVLALVTRAATSVTTPDAEV